MMCEKTVYETQKAARDACHGMGKRGRKMNSYQCPVCGKWHIATCGKKPTGQKVKKFKK
jgi:predicted RNA-binding Zn-ribbon protein involved in translation (DUF1610 family)